MNDELKVVHWGLGAMGSGIVRLVNQKTGMQSVGAFDSDLSKHGLDLGAVVGLGRELNVLVTKPKPVRECREFVEADIAIVATGSFTKDVFSTLETLVNAKLNVIIIAEEMAYPAINEPELTKALDEMAQKAGVTILGTGINPGFVLDTLVIALTGTCLEVSKIKAERINDLAPFGPTVMKSQGVGKTRAEFEQGLKDGSIVGHVGFRQSIALIARALGWEIDEIRETRDPIISSVFRKTEFAEVDPGRVAGCRHTAVGYSKGRVLIELIHPQQVSPGLEGVETGDFIEIQGIPNLNLKIQPEIPGGLGTIAMAVNMIPQVMAARSGLLNMAELPVPAAVMGDVRSLIKSRRGDS